MTKRALCFLSVLLLALLPAFASADCTHHNDDGVPYPLFPQGYIPPQVGVPGYTGDQCCTNCGAIVIRGSEIPALDPPQEEEANKREDPVPVPAAEQPVVEQPVVAQPVVEQPVVPQEQPQAPSQPAQPEAPVQTVQNTQPETPAQQAPVQPPETKQGSQPASSPANDLPAPPPENVSQPQTQQQAPSGQSAPATGGSGRSAKTARQPFSALYPYRRVKLAPQPEILAEFAGVLLWPVAGTPFLNLFGD